jgi:hypothetical protein
MLRPSCRGGPRACPALGQQLHFPDGTGAPGGLWATVQSGQIADWHTDKCRMVGMPSCAARRQLLQALDLLSGANSASWAIWWLNPPLAVIAGRPAIRLSRRTSANSNQLYFACPSTPNGSNPADWRLAVVDDSAPYTGGFASLAEVDGKPAVSYHDAGNGGLKYAIRLGP